MSDIELDASSVSPFAVSYERREWVPTQAVGRRLRDLIAGDYHAAVPPPIASAAVELDRETLVDAAEATAAITRFDAEVGGRFAPFAALLLRSESTASSQIERLTASAKAILMAEDGDTSRHNASLVAANTTAMRAAIELADQPSEATIIEMHRALIEPSDPSIVGHWRTQQVWIGGGAVSPHQASFVPPHHDRVPAAMNDLVEFMRRVDIDPFTQAMVAHAQFETIHPFPDGNGRTGRALIHAHLRHTGVTQSTTVPISAGLLASTDDYFDALTTYRRGDANPLVHLASAAALRSIDNGRQLASDVADIRERWVEVTADIRSDAVAHRVVADLPEHPIVDTTSIAARFGVAETAASRAVTQLVERDVVSKASGGLRYRKWIAHDIADALDAFAQRAGRRGR